MLRSRPAGPGRCEEARAKNQIHPARLSIGGGGACGWSAARVGDYERERAIRKGRADLEQALDQLDRLASAFRGPERRRGGRSAYRQTARLTITQANNPPLRLVVETRNLSPRGLGFLAGQFIYPGTRGQIQFSGPHGEEYRLGGTVVRCRYLPGTGCLHEVGMRFDEKIDAILRYGTDLSRRQRILVVDPRGPTGRLVCADLSTSQFELIIATTATQACDRAISEPIDLVLMELRMAHASGARIAAILRSAGCHAPILAITPPGTPGAPGAAPAGCDAFAAAPVTSQFIRRLLQKFARAVSEAPAEPDPEPLPEPALEPELGTAIESFVAALPDQLTELAGALQAWNTDALAALAGSLRSDGQYAGHLDIRDAAADLERAIATNADTQHVAAALRRLIDCCRELPDEHDSAG